MKILVRSQNLNHIIFKIIFCISNFAHQLCFAENPIDSKKENLPNENHFFSKNILHDIQITSDSAELNEKTRNIKFKKSVNVESAMMNLKSELLCVALDEKNAISKISASNLVNLFFKKYDIKVFTEKISADPSHFEIHSKITDVKNPKFSLQVQNGTISGNETKIHIQGRSLLRYYSKDKNDDQKKITKNQKPQGVNQKNLYKKNNPLKNSEIIMQFEEAFLEFLSDKSFKIISKKQVKILLGKTVIFGNAISYDSKTNHLQIENGVKILDKNNNFMSGNKMIFNLNTRTYQLVGSGRGVISTFQNPLK